MPIADILNVWAEMGVFSYVIPFLLIFCVVFAILQKTGLLGENKAIIALLSVGIALLSLVNDYVPSFFANLFPKFGIGLSIFLVLIILLGFFFQDINKLRWIGWLVGIGVVVWAVINWNDFWYGGYGASFWFDEYFWPVIILVGIIALIIWIVKSGPESGGKP